MEAETIGMGWSSQTDAAICYECILIARDGFHKSGGLPQRASPRQTAVVWRATNVTNV